MQTLSATGATTCGCAIARPAPSTTAARNSAPSGSFSAALDKQLAATTHLQVNAESAPVKIADIVANRFERYDRNRDGKITLGAAVPGVNSMLREADRVGNGDGATTTEELTSMLKTFDSNGDGALSGQERRAMRAAIEHPDAQSIKISSLVDRRFAKLDTNHDGKIREGHETHGPHTVLRAADKNGDGITTVDELTNLLTSYDANGDGELSIRERQHLLYESRHPAVKVA